MTARAALRLALRDLYGSSWKLVPVNAVLGAVLVAVAVAAVAVHALAVLVVLAGPAAAALVHAAVTLVRTGSVSLADAAEGFRLHWRRGLVLAAAGAAVFAIGAVALRFYGGRHLWPLAFLTLYLLVLAATYGLVVFTLAVAEPAQGLRAAAREATALVLRRPGATALLAVALLLVNAAGLAAAAMPFLTLTVAYSSLAVARFALPRRTPEDPS